MKWYYRPIWVVVAILAAGPFALPLVWMSPALKRWAKVSLTVVTIAITIWMIKAAIDIYQIILKEMSELQSALR